MEVLRQLSIESFQEAIQLVTVSLSEKTMLFRDSTTSNTKAVILLEFLCLTDDIEDNELIKTLQESCAQVLMQEVNESQTKDLVAVSVIPT